MLHAMETKGYLRSTEVRDGRHGLRWYRATALGKVALADVKRKVQELFGELFEEAPPAPRQAKPRRASKS
jgi:DNA-binding PadR family transcriptional regulator